MSVDYVGFFGFGTGAPASVDPSASPYEPPMCPLVVKAAGSAAISISAAIDGLIALQAQLTITPPNLTILLDALIEFQAQCSLALSFSLPTVSFDLTASAQLVADLTASLTLLLALEAMLALPVTVAYEGVPYGAPGSALPTALTPLATISDHMLILVAVDLPPPLTTGARSSLEAMLGGITYPSAGAFSNLGQMSPVTLNALAQARAAIEYQLGLALQLDAFVKVDPPTFAASIDASLKFAAYLEANIALALPSIDFQFAAIAKILLDLQLRFDILYLLGVALSIPHAYLFVYRYEDTGPPGFAVEMTAALTPNYDGITGFFPSSLPCQAAALGTIDPASWAVLVGNGGNAAFFGGCAP